MDDTLKNLSLSSEEDEAHSDVILATTTNQDNGRRIQQVSRPISPHMLHPSHSNSSTSSSGAPRHSKMAVAQALEAARRKRLESDDGSVQSGPSLSSLNLPSLQESRNDLERRRSIESLVHVKSEEGELEVTLKPAVYEEEKKMNESHTIHGRTGSFDTPKLTSSSSSLEKKMDQIILEAKLAAVQLSGGAPLSPNTDPRSNDLIQQALDRAAARSRAAAAQAVSAGAGVSQSDPGVGNKVEVPRLRSTKYVLELASKRLGLTPQYQPQQLGQQHALPPKHPQPPQEPRKTQFPASPGAPLSPHRDTYPGIHGCLSPSESVGSIDDYEKAVNRLPSRLKESDKLPREKILKRIDGVVTSPAISPVTSPIAARNQSALSTHFEDDENSIQSTSQRGVPTKTITEVKSVIITSSQFKDQQEDGSYGGWLNYFWGGSHEATSHDNESDTMAPMSCGSRPIGVHEELPAMATSLVRVMSDPTSPSYAEAVNAKKIDPRMPEWVENQYSTRESPPNDGTYQLADSKTIIVHEIIRGSWTWCTAWSPNGDRLAIATDNHHLAVVDTSSSSVWRVRHDKRVTGPAKQGTTHSIRSIAWGTQFIAIGGTGNAVSILAPTEPYPIVHTITATGFVGSLDWLAGTNTLLIGSRIGKAMAVKVWAQDQETTTAVGPNPIVRAIQSTICHTIDRQKAWINAVKFSPGGSALAIGDSKGILGVYSYEDEPGEQMTITNVANFKLEDSILDLDWSPDGQWLYAGGEDFAVTVISTQWWEAVHRIKRDRWVQFISTSNGGSHVAVGGVSSEVSILDVDKGWDTAINVSLKGLVPLSAKWHPQDQYLVLTGQNNSILAIETTNARYVSGHFLRSVSPIFSIEFSPDGRMAAIGNEAGVVTIFKLSGTTFITAYELVLDCLGSLSIQWSLNGAFLAIVAGNKVVIVTRTKSIALPGNAPPNASGFSVARVIRGLGLVHDAAIDPQSRFVAVSGDKTRILDATTNFKCVLELENGSGVSLANSWSPDGSWFATIGRNQNLLIYDTSSEKLPQWRVVFTVETKQAGLALAWGPVMPGGLQYCAFGGEDKKLYIMEIRTKERTWETVLGVPRDGLIYDLDWNSEGLVAAAIGNGTVTILDLSYLQSGWAVNEMDYNWQRQALTCATEIRRNKGKNSMRSVKWIPSAPGSDSLLAVGGTDGELEIVDLTERQRCSGFYKDAPSM